MKLFYGFSVLPLHRNMKSTFRHTAYYCLILLLAVQTLNLSVDSLRFYTPASISNSVEEQDYVDSEAEFLVENIFGFSKNTFHDKANANNNSKQQQNIVHFDLKWFPRSLIVFKLEAFPQKIVYDIPKNENLVNLYCKEVRPNPPQTLSV